MSVFVALAKPAFRSSVAGGRRERLAKGAGGVWGVGLGGLLLKGQAATRLWPLLSVSPASNDWKAPGAFDGGRCQEECPWMAGGGGPLESWGQAIDDRRAVVTLTHAFHTHPFTSKPQVVLTPPPVRRGPWVRAARVCVAVVWVG